MSVEVEEEPYVPPPVEDPTKRILLKSLKGFGVGQASGVTWWRRVSMEPQANQLPKGEIISIFLTEEHESADLREAKDLIRDRSGLDQVIAALADAGVTIHSMVVQPCHLFPGGDSMVALHEERLAAFIESLPIEIEP